MNLFTYLMILGLYTPVSTLDTITVCAYCLDMNAIKVKTEKEFVQHYKPIFEYVAIKTNLTEAQVFAIARMEQGNGSQLLTKHYNMFNVKKRKKNKSSTYLTVEYSNNKKVRVRSSFSSYNDFRSSVTDFVSLINDRYYSEELSDLECFKMLKSRGYHTDDSVRIRASLAQKYKILYNEN